MATHSSILARKIPWIEEPGGLQTALNISDYVVRGEGHFGKRDFSWEWQMVLCR